MRLKKSIQEYLELDSQITDYFNYVFTFYNIINIRRSNALFELKSFPMITMNELNLEVQEVHNTTQPKLYTSILEVQCDTIINNDIRNEKELMDLNDTLLAHEDASEYVLNKLNGLTIDNAQIRVLTLFMDDCSDSQLVYNLYNNDHERIVVRKTMTFQTKYYTK